MGGTAPESAGLSLPIGLQNKKSRCDTSADNRDGLFGRINEQTLRTETRVDLLCEPNFGLGLKTTIRQQQQGGGYIYQRRHWGTTLGLYLTLSEYTKNRMSNITSARRIISRTMKNCERERERMRELASRNLSSYFHPCINARSCCIFRVCTCSVALRCARFIFHP